MREVSEITDINHLLAFFSYLFAFIATTAIPWSTDKDIATRPKLIRIAILVLPSLMILAGPWLYNIYFWNLKLAETLR